MLIIPSLIFLIIVGEYCSFGIALYFSCALSIIFTSIKTAWIYSSTCFAVISISRSGAGYKDFAQILIKLSSLCNKTLNIISLININVNILLYFSKFSIILSMPIISCFFSFIFLQIYYFELIHLRLKWIHMVYFFISIF